MEPKDALVNQMENANVDQDIKEINAIIALQDSLELMINARVGQNLVFIKILSKITSISGSSRNSYKYLLQGNAGKFQKEGKTTLFDRK